MGALNEFTDRKNPDVKLVAATKFAKLLGKRADDLPKEFLLDIPSDFDGDLCISKLVAVKNLRKCIEHACPNFLPERVSAMLLVFEQQQQHQQEEDNDEPSRIASEKEEEDKTRPKRLVAPEPTPTPTQPMSPSRRQNGMARIEAAFSSLHREHIQLSEKIDKVREEITRALDLRTQTAALQAYRMSPEFGTMVSTEQNRVAQELEKQKQTQVEELQRRFEEEYQHIRKGLEAQVEADIRAEITAQKRPRIEQEHLTNVIRDDVNLVMQQDSGRVQLNNNNNNTSVADLTSTAFQKVVNRGNNKVRVSFFFPLRVKFESKTNQTLTPNSALWLKNFFLSFFFNFCEFFIKKKEPCVFFSFVAEKYF
jgi:hypothetical protein